MTRFAAIALATSLAACSRGGEAPSPSAPEAAAPAVAASPDVPAPTPLGSATLGGAFEFRTEVAGESISYGLRFDGAKLERLARGVVVASSPYSIVDDGPGRVTIEVSEAGAPPTRRELLFPTPDALVDAAAPGMSYARIASADEVAPPSGSGDAAPGSGDAAPGDGSAL